MGTRKRNADVGKLLARPWKLSHPPSTATTPRHLVSSAFPDTSSPRSVLTTHRLLHLSKSAKTFTYCADSPRSAIYKRKVIDDSTDEPRFENPKGSLTADFMGGDDSVVIELAEMLRKSDRETAQLPAPKLSRVKSTPSLRAVLKTEYQRLFGAHRCLLTSRMQALAAYTLYGKKVSAQINKAKSTPILPPKKPSLRILTVKV